MRIWKRMARASGTGTHRGAAGPFTLLALLALALNACSGGPSHAAATATSGLAASQTLRAALVLTPIGGQPAPTALRATDPAQAAGVPEQEVESLLFDGLVTSDPQLGVEPWGASNIAVSSDGLTYTFTLRPNQFFSDGTPVTATDYAFSLDRVLNPCVGSGLAADLDAIKGAARFSGEDCQNGTITVPPAPQGPPATPITTLVGSSIVPDDVNNLLKITLAHPAGYFLQALATPASYVLDPAVVGSVTSNSTWTTHLADGPTGHGSSGMYYLASPINGAARITLKLNPHWWGLTAGKRPHLTEIDLQLYSTPAQSLAAYNSGQVDVAYLPPAPPPAPTGATGATVTPASTGTQSHTVPLLETYALGFNWALLPADNADAREALCLAIDRTALLRQVSAADTTIQGIPTWHLLPQGLPSYNAGLTGPDGVTSIAGDPTGARTHWQRYVQSLGGGPIPSLTYLGYAQVPWQMTLGSVLQADWQSVFGVSVSVQSLQTGGPQTLPPSVTQAPTFPASWLATYADPQDILSAQYLPGATYNIANVDDTAATALLQNADSQPDPTARMEEYQQSEQLLVREAAVCPLWQATETYEVRPWVRGWSLTSLGLPADDTWASTAVLQHS